MQVVIIKEEPLIAEELEVVVVVKDLTVAVKEVETEEEKIN